MKNSNLEREIRNDLKIANFKSHRGHDGKGFNAELHYKGAKIAHVYDGAYGGEFEYTIYEGKREAYVELKARISEIPAKKDPEYDFMMKASLDIIIDEMIGELARKKDEKKGIMIEVPDGYKIVGSNLSIPTIIKKYGNGLKVVQGWYDEHKGEKIMNTDYLKTVGVKT